ncbi:hypothetical protein EYC80_008345 [Monilinia laxa]|uniref:DUF6594 domain-containing protein n=1 Tax=Monilinia laxa TaxID=61186 RepID=A0A5N6JSW4_MONLA|nr:hypothetical protein EYC80_008345 [Monilinia laxa]
MANAIRDHETLCLESSDIIFPLTGLEEHFARLTKVTKDLFSQQEAIGDVAREAQETFRALESQRISEGFEFRELNQEVRLHNERRKGFFDRLGMGIFSEIALVAPMLLMVLHHDLNTSITTASVATILFVLLLAIGGEGLAGKDVLAATAAYAAVLVVFVGTSTNNTL